MTHLNGLDGVIVVPCDVVSHDLCTVAMQVAKADKKSAVQVSGPNPKRQKVTEAEVCS